MHDALFWRQFSLVTFILILLLTGLQVLWPLSMAISPFSFLTLALFAFILILIYFRSQIAVRSEDPYLFVRLMLLFFLLKFFLCLVLVAVYWKLKEPEHEIAILPFFLIYLIYTTFEVYFLDKIARQSGKVKNGQDHGSKRTK